MTSLAIVSSPSTLPRRIGLLYERDPGRGVYERLRQRVAKASSSDLSRHSGDVAGVIGGLCSTVAGSAGEVGAAEGRAVVASA
jgi:hypothetical protein